MLAVKLIALLDAVEIIQKNLQTLNVYKNNPRKNDHAVDRIATAIREFGFNVPILIESNGKIIDGHLRYKAAKQLDLENVPCVVIDDLTPAQIKAFRLSINKMAELATWDFDLLAVEMEELRELEFALELTGFDVGEIDPLMDFGLDDTPLDDSERAIVLITCPKCGFQHEK